MILVESWAPLVYDYCSPHNILVVVSYWATTYVQHCVIPLSGITAESPTTILILH